MRAGAWVGSAILVAASLSGCSSKNVTALAVGDCFNFDDQQTEIGDVPTVKCSDAHDAEVFYVYDVTGIAEYNEDEVFNTGVEGCLDPFTSYTGYDFYDDAMANIDIYSLYPTADGWEAGDRGIVCTLVALDSTQLTGSQKKQ